MPSTTEHHQRIAGLDGLRALAVASVVLTHYGVFANMQGSPMLPLVHGVTGVSAFFVLSGFLITRLLLWEHRQSGQINYRDFVARRALRIFPLYFFFLSVVSLLFIAGYWRTNPAGLTFAWLYVYNFVPPGLYDPLLAHTWSLAVEEHFYLLWPLALLFFVRHERALIAFILLAALVSVASFVMLVRGMGATGYFLERWTVVAAFSLLVGCFAAVLSHFRPSGALTRFCRSHAGLLVAVILFAAPALLHLLPALAGRVLAAYAAVKLQSLGIAVLVLWISVRQHSYAVAALEFKPLRYLGTISYGIYIWQGFFLAVSPMRNPDSAWPPSPALGLLGIAVFAPLSYHLFEKRFLALKARFPGSRRATMKGPPPRQSDTVGV
jgi:peptidoglycan/LPS O-acetylase OafA/YrhL